MPDIAPLPADYAGLLKEIRQRVRHAQARAVLAVNAELIRLYWDIGALIHERQSREGWGAGVIPRLARDLHNELPEEKGFSERNIKRTLAFYREYPHLNVVPQPVAPMSAGEKVPQPVALFPPDLLLAVPWGHHAELMTKVKDPATRHWYMQAAVQNGWSRNILLMQIESAAHRRQGKGVSNFAARLPPADSDLVQQTLKDPYIFDFLTLEAGFHERELETGLIRHQYALRGVDKPIGIAGFELTRQLPAELQSSLPSIEAIEQALANEPDDESS
jgi:predicted nuclease of restriction endonuclease-like (RecB) superfamily